MHPSIMNAARRTPFSQLASDIAPAPLGRAPVAALPVIDRPGLIRREGKRDPRADMLVAGPGLRYAVIDIEAGLRDHHGIGQAVRNILEVAIRVFAEHGLRPWAPRRWSQLLLVPHVPGLSRKNGK